ncbi:MAG: peptidoglycan editing factor PgeF [Alloprevotella sp.]|nr:peptidoglycan editing factor PgeF [Alloprevotella sp.]
MHYSLHPDVCAFSTERGRVADASAPYDGFNVTHYCGDAPEHVAACRQALCADLGIGRDGLVLPRQTHGTRVVRVSRQTMPSELEGVDAVTTDEARLCIGVSTADCLPLLLYDAEHHACAAVHAGWRGALAHIAARAVQAMQTDYGSRPEALAGAIGPHISLDSFEVGDEVFEAFADAGFPMQQIAMRYAAREGQQAAKWHISLERAVLFSLQQAGVNSARVSSCHVCTYQDFSRFFSARRLGIQSGRIFTGVMLRG